MLLLPSVAWGEDFGMQFALSFSLEDADDENIAALGELLDILTLEGSYALHDDSFDLHTNLQLERAEETRTDLYLYGVPSRWYLQSSLLGDQTALFDMVSALEFGIKINAHMDIPLQNLFLLLPYVHQSAFAAMTDAARPILFARETTRSVSKSRLLTLCDTLNELARTDRAFTYWLQSVASLTDDPEGVTESVLSIFAGLRDWLNRRVEDGLSITVKGQTETWKLRRITLYERTWDETSEHMHFSLPDLPNGTSWEVDYTLQRADGTADMLLTVDAVMEDDSPLLHMTLQGSALPQALPVHAPFALQLSLTYRDAEEVQLWAQGEGNNGSVTLCLTDKQGTRLGINGTVLPWVPEVWPDHVSDTPEAWAIFSLYEQTLADFTGQIARPMLLGAIPLLAHAPVKVCTVLMDLATQAGLFEIETAGSSYADY